MDGHVTMALPRPGPALKTVLLLIGAIGIFEAFLANYVPGGIDLVRYFVCRPGPALLREPWRLLTAGLLTSPESVGHLIFTIIGLYFLSPDLERRWGAFRFARFLALSVVVGFLFSGLVDAVAPPSAPAGFHPQVMYGAGAAITATAVAWSKMNAHLQVRLFFFLPITGRQLLWVTIGFCVLGLFYPNGIPEGVAAPFGGVVVGLLFGGTPSVVRAIYLRIKLLFLRRTVGSAAVRPLVKPPVPRSRGKAPPLRVVPGGLEEELGKRRPPKDKRYLN